MLPDPHHPGAFRVVTGDTSQSWVDPAQPTRLEFEYVQRVAEALGVTVLARPADERVRVVHLGGGGLTIPRYIEAVRPHSAQIVCEPDAVLLDEVRRKLPLDRHSGIKVRQTDGRTGMAGMPDDYADAIVLDAFDGLRVPGELATVEFFADAARVLHGRGVLLVNLTDQGPFAWTRRCLAGLRRRFSHVLVSAESAVLKGRRFGNLVVVASGVALPLAALERAAASAPFPYRTLSERDLDRWLGAAVPFSDPDAQASPGPVRGRTWFQ